MRVVLFLKYIPSRSEDRKSDSLWSVVDGLRNAGIDVVLGTQGRVDSAEERVIPVSLSGVVGLALLAKRRLALYLKFFDLATWSRDKEIEFVVRRWMKRNGSIDAVIALCTGNHPAVLGAIVAKIADAPLLIREHKIYENSVHSLSDLDLNYLRALRAASRLYAVSPFLAETMKRIGVRDDIGVIPNSISEDFFGPPERGCRNALCANIKWSAESFIFGGWTRWREIKRVDLLLKAFKQVYLQNPMVRLLIAGPIEPESNARWAIHFVKENGLEDVVCLFGRANREQVHQIAHMIDCGVVPSDYETFGLPALEALAAGKPVVTTRCNGPEWLVRDDRFGRCVDRGSSTALAQAMIEVYNSRYEFDNDFIRSEIWNNFSRTAVSRQWSEAIHKAVAAKNEASG